MQRRIVKILEFSLVVLSRWCNIGSPLGIVDWANSVKAAIFQGINPFIPITKEQFALEIGLLFFTPPPIPDAVVVEKVNDYNIRNRHYG